MKKLLKRLRWAIQRNSIENGLLEFCKLEYSKGEVQYAYNRVLAYHKHNFINGGSV